MDHRNTPCAPVRRARADDRSPQFVAALCGMALATSDVLSIALAGQLFGVLGIGPAFRLFERIDFACAAAFVASAVSIARFVTLQHYVKRMPALRELRELLVVLALACACHIALLALHGNAADVFPTSLVWACVAVLMPPGRLVVKLLLMKLHLWQRDLYVIGSGRLALDATTAIKSEPLMGLALRAFVPVGESLLPTDAPVAPLRPLDASSLAGSVIMIALDPERGLAEHLVARAGRGVGDERGGGDGSPRRAAARHRDDLCEFARAAATGPKQPEPLAHTRVQALSRSRRRAVHLADALAAAAVHRVAGA
jgi:hypothetical protein